MGVLLMVVSTTPSCGHPSMGGEFSTSSMGGGFLSSFGGEFSISSMGGEFLSSFGGEFFSDTNRKPKQAAILLTTSIFKLGTRCSNSAPSKRI